MMIHVIIGRGRYLILLFNCTMVFGMYFFTDLPSALQAQLQQPRVFIYFLYCLYIIDPFMPNGISYPNQLDEFMHCLMVTVCSKLFN